MTNLSNLFSYCKEMINAHPQLKDDIMGLYELAVSEIEEGGSEIHECMLAYDDITELIKESI
jgi:hypothetical protein